MGAYQVSHLQTTHMGFRLAVIEMIDGDRYSHFRAIAERTGMKISTRFPEWYLRRALEGNAVKISCFTAALAAQGR